MDQIFKQMVKYSWTDIHYANAFLPDDNPNIDNPKSWSVGIRTGPDNQDICIIHCKSEIDVEKFRSPLGNSINEAIIKSKKKYNSLILGIQNSGCRKNTYL